MPAAQRLTTGCCLITATLSPVPRDATSASQPLELQQASIFVDLWCMEHTSRLHFSFKPLKMKFLNFHPITS
uniref:Putative secreted protein n=1 Tax=Ixodes ricinus TaxID=34613 RepID=A0A6B0TUE6_IXORI